MSRGASPSHRFAGNFDAFYDPDYTAEINTKMQVPQRIRVIEDGHDEQANRPKAPVLPGKYSMNVPERILVAGGETHIEDREPPPELRLENTFVPSANPNVIHLNTPPHVLTMGEHHFPVIEEEELSDHCTVTESNHIIAQVQNGYAVTSDTSTDVSTALSHPQQPGSGNASEEMRRLQWQVIGLTNRLLRVEQDNQERQQREFAFCVVTVLYFFMKGLVWLRRHW